MSNINPRFLKPNPDLHRNLPSLKVLKEGIIAGDRVLLAKAITLIESTKESHQKLGQELIEACLPYANNSFRIGITGSPGVGKSTFIESLGEFLITRGRRLAVLAIDPSSALTKGSILGDKTRMMKLSTKQEAFIRPSPAGNSLGGVARKTRETIILCEAAGFDTIIVETVGVGQSEIAVHSMVDFFLLLLLPGAGDELQGIKRGIVEMADMIIVNKADGGRENQARQTQRAYANAIHLFPPKESNWPVKVKTCSALSQDGIPQIWEWVEAYYQFSLDNHHFQERRKQQARFWLMEALEEKFKQLLFHQEETKVLFEQLEKEVLSSKLSPFQAAERIFKNLTDHNSL